MRRSAADALLALAFALTGCTFDDGNPWGEAEVGLRASFEVPASRVRPDGAVKTARDYAVKLDALKLTFSTLTIGMSEGEGDTPAGFDPAAPPEGFSLCHNGHCHGDDGKLYSYAEVAAAAAGGGSAGGAAPVVTVDVGSEDGVALTGTPVDVPLSGCPCDLPRGTLTAAQLTVTHLQVRGSVTDLRPTSRLASPVVQVDLDLPLDAVFSAPLEGGVTRGDFADQQFGFAATLVLTPKVLDAIDFSLSTLPAELGAALSETVRDDSTFTVTPAPAGSSAETEAETVDGEGCEHQAEGPALAVTAAAEAAGADAAAIDDDHHRYDVAFVDLAAGQKGGSVTFAADADGEFHFFFDTAVTYEVLDASGAPVARESTVASTETCDVIHQWDVYDLSVGTYTLTFAPTDAAGVKIVVENAGAAHDHTHE